jgi:small subunit ribosomal protein S3
MIRQTLVVRDPNKEELLGHKVHPIGFRLGVVKGWQSRWFAERDYKDIFAEDVKIRGIINKELANAAVSRIEIERAAANQILIIIYTAKPGIVIGKSGEKVERLKAGLEKSTKKRVRVEIKEIRQPELDAILVARSIAEQLEKRVSFRRAMKQAVQKSMRSNAKGIKVIVGGRLGGAEIARSEKEVEGKVPLQTLRADIDYGQAEAHTTFGVIGIKVWIYTRDILPSKRREPGEAQPETSIQPAYVPSDRGDRRSGDRRRDGGQQRGERGPRPQGDRPRGGDRGPRPQGDRPPRPQGERQGPVQGRPQGDRPPRPTQGQGGPRPPRPQGDRPPRPRGEQPSAAKPGLTNQGQASAQDATQSAPPTSPTPITPPVTPNTNAGTADANQSE